MYGLTDSDIQKGKFSGGTPENHCYEFPGELAVRSRKFKILFSEKRAAHIDNEVIKMAEAAKKNQFQMLKAR
jgi:hypothetical protein